jgi:hypothetical protein
MYWCTHEPCLALHSGNSEGAMYSSIVTELQFVSGYKTAYNIVTYTPGARQRLVSKQLHDQTLLASLCNNGITEERCFLRGPNVVTMANGVFWRSVGRFSGQEFKLQTRPLVREGTPRQQTRTCLKIIINKEEKLVAGPRWLAD